MPDMLPRFDDPGHAKKAMLGDSPLKELILFESQYRMTMPMTRVGLGVLDSMLGPTFSIDASLLGSGVSLDSPLEGHSLRHLASITPGLARNFLFYFIFDDANELTT